MQRDDPYILQQLALATYKFEQPDKKAALIKAQGILSKLAPQTSSDAETVGLWGAMHKRLWDQTQNRDDLDESIKAYGGATTSRTTTTTASTTPLCSTFAPRCESACKKDPLFGVIGIQSGPRNRGSTLASLIRGSRGWDACRGDNCKDSPGVFRRGQGD
jgi:hypothetical protein